MAFVLANLQIECFTGKTSGKGKSVESDLDLVVENIQDDASDAYNIVLTFPATTYRASADKSHQLFQAAAKDPNVPAGNDVIGSMMIPMPSIAPKKKASVKVMFTMTEEGLTVGGPTGKPRVGAFVFGPRPDSDGSNNTRYYELP